MSKRDRLTEALQVATPAMLLLLILLMLIGMAYQNLGLIP